MDYQDLARSMVLLLQEEALMRRVLTLMLEVLAPIQRAVEQGALLIMAHILILLAQVEITRTLKGKQLKHLEKVLIQRGA